MTYSFYLYRNLDTDELMFTELMLTPEEVKNENVKCIGSFYGNGLNQLTGSLAEKLLRYYDIEKDSKDCRECRDFISKFRNQLVKWKCY